MYNIAKQLAIYSYIIQHEYDDIKINIHSYVAS